MKSIALASLGIACALFTGCRTMNGADGSHASATTNAGAGTAGATPASTVPDVARITMATEDLVTFSKVPAIAYDANGQEVLRLNNCAHGDNGHRCSDGTYEVYLYSNTARWTKIGDANAAPRFFDCDQNTTPASSVTFVSRHAFDCKPTTTIKDKNAKSFFEGYAKDAKSFYWAWDGKFLAAVAKDEADAWIGKVRAVLPTGTYEGIMTTASKTCEIVVADTANGGLTIELASTGGTRKKLDNAVLDPDTIRGASSGNALEKPFEANSAVVGTFLAIDYQPLDTLKGDKAGYSAGTLMISPKWENPMSGKAGLYVQTQHAKYCRRLVKKS